MFNTVRALGSKLLFKIVLDLLIRYPQGGSHMHVLHGPCQEIHTKRFQGREKGFGIL